MNSLVDYTDKAIMKILLDQVQQLNPWVVIGDTMTGPVASASGGKILDLNKIDAPPQNLVKIKNASNYALPSSRTRPKPITAGSVKLKLDDVAKFRTAGLQSLKFNLTKTAYLYPYSVDIPNREWLEEYKLGDPISVEVEDPTTLEISYVETPLTQQMIDDNAELIFRFALSDQ